MDKRLIWMIKSAKTNSTRKSLRELTNDPALFIDAADVSSEEAQKNIRAYNAALEGGYGIVTYIDEEYPQALREIALPPRVLFVRGNKNAIGGVYAAIVGSRRADSYGIQTASSLAFEIGKLGVGVVSGGADGIDAAAHWGAVRAGAPTVAVLGCGIDVKYPKKNTALFERIENSGGAIITEFLPSTPPERGNFPHRNRLIAALSETTAVVRAGVRSGALITAMHAERMCKTVFAVPGNIDCALSAGTNALIRDGAMVLTSALDLIDELVLKQPHFFTERELRKNNNAAEERAKEEKEKEKAGAPFAKKRENTARKTEYKLSDTENNILNAVRHGFTTKEQIAQNVDAAPGAIAASLSLLEMKGAIKRELNGKYKLLIGGES